MITVTVTKKYGAATVRARVSAPTIEEVVAIAGPNARVEFPIDGETFFAPVTEQGIDFAAMSTREVEAALDAGLAGAYEAWLERLMDEMDDGGSEVPEDATAAASA